MSETDKITVAVYGSLKKGYSNHPLLSSSKLLFAQWVQGFTMSSLSAFPACHEADTDKEVWVEVYEVTPEVFTRLDQLEGYPRMYNRKQLLLGDNGTENFCNPWIYYMEGESKYPSVPSGFWENPMMAQRSQYMSRIAEGWFNEAYE